MAAKKQAFSIAGKKYPSYHTLGAYRQFETLTGKSVTDIGNDITDLSVFLYCVVSKACKRDGVEFPYNDPDAFADDLTLDELMAWQADQVAEAPEDKGAKKKK